MEVLMSPDPMSWDVSRGSISTCLPTRFPPTREGASGCHEQTTGTRIVDFFLCLGEGRQVMTSWRVRDTAQEERTAQHNITDGRIIGQPDVHVQAVGQLLTGHEFERLNCGRLSRESRTQRARRGALQIGPHVFRGECWDLAGVHLESWGWAPKRLCVRHVVLHFRGTARMIAA